MLSYLRVLHWGDPLTWWNEGIEKPLGCVALHTPLWTRCNPMELVLLGNSQVLYQLHFIYFYEGSGQTSFLSLPILSLNFSSWSVPSSRLGLAPVLGRGPRGYPAPGLWQICCCCLCCFLFKVPQVTWWLPGPDGEMMWIKVFSKRSKTGLHF